MPTLRTACGTSARRTAPTSSSSTIIYHVQVVVRLNEPNYDMTEFERAGLAVADLPFDDCSTPPSNIVAKFLAIAEGVPGAVAVHCKAGLGRTGTLIALYMMKHHGFTAREAIGWLRIMRPGSVIGRQQQFLCEMEPAMWQARLAFKQQPELPDSPDHTVLRIF